MHENRNRCITNWTYLTRFGVLGIRPIKDCQNVGGVYFVPGVYRVDSLPLL